MLSEAEVKQLLTILEDFELTLDDVLKLAMKDRPVHQIDDWCIKCPSCGARLNDCRSYCSSCGQHILRNNYEQINELMNKMCRIARTEHPIGFSGKVFNGRVTVWCNANDVIEVYHYASTGELIRQYSGYIGPVVAMLKTLHMDMATVERVHTHKEEFTVDIGSGNGYPSAALSNFAPHPFTIDGVECSSMEGFLQSLKFDNVEMQKYVCTLVGKAAKFKGKKKKWYLTQTLYWQGVAYRRDSPQYQNLLDRAYDALSQNAGFAKALLATGSATLTHSIGKNKISETVLTSQEFCSRLTRLRSQLQT